MENKPYILTRNKPYPLTLPANQGMIATFFSGLQDFLILCPDLRDSEIQAFRHGKISIGLLVDLPLILILMDIQKFGTFDAPFDIRLHRDPLPIPTLDEINDRFFLSSALVDSRSKIVHGLRAFTLPPTLSKNLSKALLAQRQFTEDEMFKKKLSFAYSHSMDALMLKTKMYEVGK